MKPLQTGRSHLGIFPCAPQKPYLEKAYPATKAHIKCFKPPPLNLPVGRHHWVLIWKRKCGGEEGGTSVTRALQPIQRWARKWASLPLPICHPRGGLALQP